jgi:urease accessory protein
MDIPMDDAALYRLMTWLSPGFPVGAYAYSHGLEWAVEDGAAHDRDTLGHWLEDILQHGGGRSDAILFHHAWAAARIGDQTELADINDLAIALAPSRERRLETVDQGRAFLIAIAPTWPWDGAPDIAAFDGQDLAYPIAVAMAAAGHDVDLRPALGAYLHGVAANLVSAGVRLIPLGQTQGQQLIAHLEPVIHAITEDALTATLDDLGGAAFLADIASMRHETQYTRLFRT